MPDDFIRQSLVRIEEKLDRVAADGGETRESLAVVRTEMREVRSTIEDHTKRISLLEGFRFKILGAIAAAGASGGGIAALVSKLLGT